MDGALREENTVPPDRSLAIAVVAITLAAIFAGGAVLARVLG